MERQIEKKKKIKISEGNVVNVYVLDTKEIYLKHQLGHAFCFKDELIDVENLKDSIAKYCIVPEEFTINVLSYIDLEYK